ncbi:MAG: glycerol-3-phosphate 1-O-acyltransferase PlsY [Candidatus Omnitrophica bacterium]|nr:glycerol-3-phosphate 1-O-acyltransferase PlsY [Candidatus Omnitrophota bacterium]
MMDAWGPLLALTGSYLVGSIPTAYLLVKRLKRVDVRTVGSGNVGATNVTRVAGMGAGAVVFLLDVAKGLIAVWGMSPWLARPVTPAAQLACGLAAVLGHSFPVFLRFRGGKGVATTIGVLVGAVPLIAAGCLAVWVGSFLIWRYVSVGSLAAAATLPLLQLLAHRPLPERWLGSALALVIIARHRANILRLLRGTEHRAGRPRGGP